MQNALKYMRNWWVEQLNLARQTKFVYITGQSLVDPFLGDDDNNFVEFLPPKLICVQIQYWYHWKDLTMQNALIYMRNWWAEHLNQARPTKFDYLSSQSLVDQFLWADNTNFVEFLPQKVICVQKQYWYH